MSPVVQLPDLVIPAGLEDSNELRASAHFGDAARITIYPPTGVWTAPPPEATGIMGIEIAPIEFPTITDWRLVGSDDHTAADVGIKMQPVVSRTIPVCFNALRLHGFPESFARVFKVSKVVVESTASYAQLEDVIRSHVLAAAGVAAILGTRLYIDEPPKNAVPPFAVMRLVNDVAGDDEHPMIRTTFEVEFMLFHRGRSGANSKAIRDLGDALDRAFLDWVHLSDGLVFRQMGRLRDRLPPATSEDIAGDVIQERLLYPLTAWPAYLTSALS